MFADMYLPHVSGVTNHVRLYKAELERQGHEVFVFTYGNRDYRDLEPNVLRSPAVPYGDTGWNVPLGLSREAVAAMGTLDIAHAHHPFASCLAALRQGKRHSIPVVFTNHTRYDIYSDTYAAWIPAGLRHGAIRKYLMWLNRRVSLTISPSADVAEWLAGYGATPDKLLVFPNAIDVAPFAHPTDPRTKADLGLAEDAFAFCYVGRVAHEKNVALLLDAFKRAARIEPRLALVLVGDGPARSECERTVAEAGLSSRVKLLGMTPYEEVPGILAAADGFATASVSEMYPLVVVEACAAGLPVIGVRSPGVGEIVTDGVSGLLSAENADEIAGAMVEVSRDGVLADRLREGAHGVAQAHEIGESTRSLLEVYERLRERRG